MSPSEKDLRASLEQGEGDPVDVDRIVAAGATARSQRRTRLAGVAAAVVLVTAGASVTGVVLARHDGAGSGGSASDYDARGAAGGAAQSRRSAERPAAAPAPSSSDSASPRPACPATFPQRMLPGGGSPGQFGSGTPLFASEPVSITACTYSVTGAVAGSTVFTGRDATALRVSLEQGSRTAPSCPIARPAVPVRRLAFLGVDAAGRSLRVVTTTISTSYCTARTSNGTAIRFMWTPPTSLLRRLNLPSTPVLPSPTGKIVGSPVR